MIQGERDAVSWAQRGFYHAARNKVFEFLVGDGAIVILITLLEHIRNLLASWLEAKGTHGERKLSGVDHTRLIGVEELKGLFKLLLLFCSDDNLFLFLQRNISVSDILLVLSLMRAQMHVWI